MFGHQDDKKDHTEDDHTATEVIPEAPETDTSTAIADDDTAAQSVDDDQTASDSSDDAWQHPGEPLEDEGTKDDKSDDKGSGHISDIIAPTGNAASAPHIDRPIVGGSNPDFSFSSPSDEDENVPHELIDIKQKALHELTPLIDKLDQAPEDRFRTLMMMIQASDDQKLVKEAYEAAHSIQDDKVRGQALLDIVNEITYFTQHPEA